MTGWLYLAGIGALIVGVFCAACRWYERMFGWPSSEDPGLTAGTVVPLVRRESELRAGRSCTARSRRSARNSIL